MTVHSRRRSSSSASILTGIGDAAASLAGSAGCLLNRRNPNMGIQWPLRGRQGLQDARDDLVGAESVGQGLVRQYQPVPEHVGNQVHDVVRQRIVTSAQEGQR